MTLPNTARVLPPVEAGDGGEPTAPGQGRESLREQLFGLALFFSGIEILFEGQPQMLDTHRRQCRNLIQRGYAALDQVERTPGGGDAAPDFIGDGPGAAETRQLLGRAEALVAAYRELFPGRDRSIALSREETLSLMEAAALRAQGR